MLCQKCHEKTASVFINSIINGKETRTYLCNDCAKDYPIYGLNMDEPFSIKDIMEKLKDEDSALSKEEDFTENINHRDRICSNCNTSYNDYRETGKLGCSNCYYEFEEQLKPLMNTMYGYAEYTGKVPENNGNHIYVNNEIKILREDLNIAVEKEDYEKAANIRDRIRQLEACKE